MTEDETKKSSEIAMPSVPGDTAATVVGDKIWFVTIEYDDSPENPSNEWDGFGKFHSLSTRHYNFNEDCPQILKDDEDAVPLSYYEHGNCMWFTADGPTPCGVEFQWDGVSLAGVWEPDDHVRESTEFKPGTDERRAWMREQAESACETYTQWCNGSVYGYSVTAYAVRRVGDDIYDEESDYRLDDTVFEESCWGFYGWDSVEEAVKDVIDSATARNEEDV